MRKRNRGQDLDINANDWNRVCDLAGNKVGQTAGRGARAADDCVWIKNTLGRDLPRWSAVFIGKPTPDELATGQNDQVYSLINPSMQGQQSAGEPIIGILNEPIASTRIGLAQVYGVTPAFFRYDESATTPGDFACISDLGDMLTFANGGPIRVLSRHAVSLGNSTKGWLVQLGTSPSQVSVNWLSEEITWNTALGYDYGNIWDGASKWGDAVRCGLYQVGTTSELRINRLGRWLVNIDWHADLLSGFASTDTLAWRVLWHGNLDGIGGGVHFAEYGRADAVWLSGGGLGNRIAGGRSFTFNITSNAPQTLHLPWITGRVIPASGSPTSTTVNGRIRIRVQRVGSPAYTTEWTETKRDNAWARGSTAGPI